MGVGDMFAASYPSAMVTAGGVVGAPTVEAGRNVRVFWGCSEIMIHCIRSVPVTKSPGSDSTEGHRERGKKNTLAK